MADSQSKRQRELESLLAERKKYETWLEQLEARRTVAAEHVFARVHADYTQRLDEVRAKLAGEADTIAALVAELDSRLADEHAEVTAKTDERAEAELRALVGEYSAKEWDVARGKLDDAIAERRKRFDATKRELADLTELLGSVNGESPAPRASAKQSAATVVEDDLAEAARSGEQDAADGVAEDADVRIAPTVGVETLGAYADTGANPSEAETSAPEPSAVTAAEVDAGIAADVDESIPDESTAAEEPGVAAGAGVLSADGPGFDELAFLRSVAGTPAGSGAATVISDNAASSRGRAPAAERGRGTIDEPSTGERNRKADAPAEDAEPGPLGAPTPRTSQAIRSLKCQECGTLNFPTEWYCERCGGELAAF